MRNLFWYAGFILLWTGCKTTGPAVSNGERNQPASRVPAPREYKESNARLHDILHQELRVQFDWEARYLFGRSTLTVKPYFYPSETLYLDARGMQVNELSLVNGDEKTPLSYTYRNDSLRISLDKTYSRTDTFQVFIDYVAKPDELTDPEGSAAITSDKGLYFINPDGSDPDKPRQLWTQCETQAGSVWFPTIDSPNERFTQEIYMTVDTAMVTLSNGLLVSSIVNESQGVRTDYWKQSLPAAPYLTMMAAGPFSVVHDRWRDMDVSYFVDPEYAPYARDIFGNTPEMLEFFSNKLGVDYPWEKYAQVVVHDYVSGAMENTSATVHGEFMQRDKRALLDETNEDVVSHELFHQWFGDLVTCESWSHIAMNESFATYGEYLWNEYKYGREEADYYGMKDLYAYLQQAKTGNAPLVRFEYEEPEEIFDRISYQKGGRILHMLRYAVGDDAFFSGLTRYLEQNRFKPVEAHHLRLAMEEVSGKDLKWFFDQWFFDQGHPDLDISYEYIDSLNVQAVIIEQVQDFEKYPLFRLPLQVDLYAGNEVESHEVICRHAREIFLFDVNRKPDLVNVDAQKMLVCTKDDHKSAEEWIHQFEHAPLFLDRYEALTAIGRDYEAGTKSADMVMSALTDSMWAIRQLAILYIRTLATDEPTREKTRARLMEMARHDNKAAVREDALGALSKYYDDPSLSDLYLSAVNDSSYDVMGRALNIMIELDKEQGSALAARFEKSDNTRVRRIIYYLYAKHGRDENDIFMKDVLSGFESGDKYSAVVQYAHFLTLCRPSTIESGISIVADVAAHGNPWFVRMAGMQGLAELSRHCEKQTAENPGDTALAGAYSKLQERIDAKMKSIKEAETNKNLRRMYGTGSHE